MNLEKSCGAVIYRRIGENLEFLSISDKSDGHWGFPKGHVEQNESEEETAIREICEETGLQVNLINGFRVSVEYSIKQKTTKEVVFFLAKVENQTVNIQLEELCDFKWASFQFAKQLLTYKSSKEVLEQAWKFIASSR
ncbi:NUDIX domain-containing protein [Clostridium algoriphilum]|uniref:bis(5'-nucleosyl)-tetraphosphatase n=1 Tax=Clostridium algoriphilum TaxID=198347 RepID=UPI001CF525E1|nr:NUDIX domain-containing protein [Clostridium algoriphilum]MCB2292846.1 NUDIX domain-containing protein [Clostridium algoriphilum]